jgi:hypothetical protein
MGSARPADHDGSGSVLVRGALCDERGLSGALAGHRQSRREPAGSRQAGGAHRREASNGWSAALRFAGLSFLWYDCWVGWYYDRDARVLYVCPLPMVVLRFEKEKSAGQ